MEKKNRRSRGVVVKKRSSSGCLIPKSKPHKESKSISTEEEALELYRRRGASSSKQASAEPLVYKRGVGNHGAFSSRMSEFDDVVLSRGKLDVYEFDEYDDLSDVERVETKRFYDSKGGDLIYRSRSLGNEGVRLQGNDRILKRKSRSFKSSEESDGNWDDSDDVDRKVKRGRSGGNNEETPHLKKELKVKGSSGTEKQLLREKIRTMLVNAGWTIDYRPRRGRDYSDAVYINPSGTAYWSIIKAYDAFQKDVEEDDPEVEPISEDILSQLTRQTRKKIEKELKRKIRDEVGGKSVKEHYSSDSEKDDDKLSSFIKRSGKSLKGKMLERGEKSTSISKSRSVHGRESRVIGRCTLLVRNSEKGQDSSLNTGKRNLVSWLIDSGSVKLSEKVGYMNRRRTRSVLDGWIARDGIHCGCCSKIVSVSKFEIHAGSQLRQPFQNIYLSSGVSLFQCQVDAWKRQDVSQRNGFYGVDVDGDDHNDDTCSICGDGGNLICCDSCPSTFHQNCLDIWMLPPGDWHCPHCSCKFCGLADVSVTEGSDTGGNTLLSCDLCEGKYHASCVEVMDVAPVNSKNSYSSASFCGKKCQEIFERLQKLLGVKHELETGFSWSLIHRSDLGFDASGVRCPQRVEWNSKLAVALTVMEECFLPIIDRRSGINMIHNVLYNCGSNFTRLNYSSFYTAILEKGDEIVSAASIRIRGNQYAEMPFIGTRYIHRHQGMCRRLFSALESALCSLHVEKLVIPAISELMDIWTRGFGFGTLGDTDKLEIKTLNLLAFPGTDMLKKKLGDQEDLKRNLTGVGSLEAGCSPLVVPDMPNKCDLDSSPEPGDTATLPHDDLKNDSSVSDFCSQDAMGSVEETCQLNTFGDISLEANPYVVSNEIKPLVSIQVSHGTVSSLLELDANLNKSSIEVNEQICTAVGPLEAGCSPSVVLDLPDKCVLDGCPEPGDTATLPNDDLKNDKSVSDFCSQGAMGSVEETCQLNTSGDNSNEAANPYVVSNEIKPLIPIQVSFLQELDANLNESSIKVKEQICTDVETGKPFNGSLEKHDIEASVSPKLVQKVGKADDDMQLPPTGIPLTGASDASVCGSLGNDGCVLSGETLCSKNESSVDKDDSLSTVEVEKQNTSFPAEGIVQDAMQVKVGVGYQVLSKLADCSSSQTAEPLTMSQNMSHGTVGVEKFLPDSFNGVSNRQNLAGEMHQAHDVLEVSSIQTIGNSYEFSCQNVDTVGVDKPQHDLCDVDGKWATSEGEVLHAHEVSIEVSGVQAVSNISCETSAISVCTVGVDRYRQLEICAGGTNQPLLEDKAVDKCEIGVETASFQPGSNFSGKVSVYNVVDALDKTQPNTSGERSEAILEVEVLPELDVSVKLDSAAPIRKTEANPHTSDNPPSPDGGTGKIIDLPVSDHNDQCSL